MYIYYVYQYLREDLTPYYIGKGKGPRAYDKRRTINLPTKDRIQFVAHNLSEFEAHQLEMKLIAYYGRKDINTGILRNRTAGGEGTSGRKISEITRAKFGMVRRGKSHTPESKQKMVDAHSNMSMETRKKMSAAKLGKPGPRKGIIMSDEIKAKISATKRRNRGHIT